MEFIFKKIKVDSKTFDNIATCVYTKYMEADESTCRQDMKKALEQCLFEVEEPFDPDGWNACTITPPPEYQGTDVLIRRSNVERDSDSSHTHCMTAYTNGYYSTSLQSFVTNTDGFFDKMRLENYEYKLIK